MKITPDHLARGAFIYIRQSTVDQLANNHESRLRQYASPIVPALWAGRM
jgi:DNA invertase Pin-like site-specific DNA recombinase